MSLLLCWFLNAGNKEAPHAQLTGVQNRTRAPALPSFTSSIALGDLSLLTGIELNRAAKLLAHGLYVLHIFAGARASIFWSIKGGCFQLAEMGKQVRAMPPEGFKRRAAEAVEAGPGDQKGPRAPR